jgi:putative nucleotidyltransferase with HDIG domain
MRILDGPVASPKMTPSLDETEQARARRLEPMGRRELAAQALVASLFLVAAGALLAFGRHDDVDALDLVLLIVATAALGRLEFEIGAGEAVPTQLVFVPMLFVLPPAIVPLAVAAALLLDRIPGVLTGRWHAERLLTGLGDAWFAIGPALVFELGRAGAPALGDWPLYLLALLAQFVGDAAGSGLRARLAHGVAAPDVLRALREVWFVDLLLSPIGLLAAYATVLQPRAYLLALPLAALLAVFARERRARIGNAIELSAAYRGTALLLGDVLSSDDEYTGAHSQGVVELSLVIADELHVDEEERRLVEFGAMLHDIGKITTPDEILNKPGPLDAEEWVVMREHTLAGQRLLDRVGGTLHEVGLVVRSSHERYDGGGYPDGLAGEQIPLAARIVAVADAYSAMTTRRSYRDALAPEVAITELGTHAGTQFDPVVAAAAIRALAPD